jgi:hypothetical protein
MLQKLQEALTALPSLVARLEGWNTLYADTERPHLSRMWRPFGPNRIYLHVLEPCKPNEAFFHPHPWPMATQIIMGKYEQCLGFGDPSSEVGPTVSERRTYSRGESYELLDPRTWHSVQPIDLPCLTFMISGAPFDDASGKRRGNTPSRPLELEERMAILSMFHMALQLPPP